jgi:hypothetical protein
MYELHVDVCSERTRAREERERYTYTHTHTHIQTHTQTYTNTHTHMYTHARVAFETCDVLPYIREECFNVKRDLV